MFGVGLTWFLCHWVFERNNIRMWNFILFGDNYFWKVSFANMGNRGATLIFTRLLANQHLCWWIHILPTHTWWSVMPSTLMECHTFWIFFVNFEHELQKWEFVFHEKVHSHFVLFKGYTHVSFSLLEYYLYGK